MRLRKMKSKEHSLTVVRSHVPMSTAPRFAKDSVCLHPTWPHLCPSTVVEVEPHKKYMEHVFGPIIGTSIDRGARRRVRVRVLILEMALCPEGNMCYPVPREECSIFCASREDNNAKYVIRTIPYKDFIHNVRKLIKVLFHASMIMVGKFVAYLYQLQQVRESFPADHHGI